VKSPQRIVVALAATLLALINSASAQQAEPNPDIAAPFGSPISADQAVWFHAILDQFEGRFASGSSLRWEGEAWTGTDTNRLWLKSEGELQNGRVSDGQQEVLYDTPISAYFDLQGGIRYDLDSMPGRGWAALGIEGLSPDFFRVSVTAYAGDTGHYGAKLFGSYDLLITQRLILQPETEWNIYTKADPRGLTGAGVSNVDSGLRLRYEISRKFAPYIGLSYEKRFGETRRLAAAAGENSDGLRFALGLRSWF
jgi:copper resistance protein B